MGGRRNRSLSWKPGITELTDSSFVGAVCTYDEIAEQIWGVGEGVTPGAIYELVKWVRQKVELHWRELSHLVTVPGERYRLQTPQ